MKILKQTSLWLILGSLTIGLGFFYFFDTAGLKQQNWIYIIGFASLGTALASWPLSRLNAWKQSLGLLLYYSVYALLIALAAPLSLSPLTAMQTMGKHLSNYEKLPESAVQSENLVLQTIARHKYAATLPEASFKIEAGVEYSNMQTGFLHCTQWSCSVEGLAAKVTADKGKLIVEAEDGSWRFIIDEGLQLGNRYVENGISLYIYPENESYPSSEKALGNPYELRFCRWLQQHLAKDSASYPVIPNRLSERY